MSRPGTDDPWMGPLPASLGCDCHICRPDDSYDDEDRRTIETVLRHGWQVLVVSDEVECSHHEHAHDQPEHDEIDPSPAFAYTLGLGHRCGHPELLMSGLDPLVMHRALNDIAQRVMDGRHLAPGDALENVLAGVPVAIEQVADTAVAETVTWSGWFHRRRPEALAVVWPDKSGVFPWQPGAPHVLEEAQPSRWRVPFQHRRGLEADPPWPFPVPPDHTAFSCTHVVDDGAAVLWAARESDESRGEDWSIHCGADRHDTSDMRLTHLAHLVRSAPSLRSIAHLGLGEEAGRSGPDSDWVTARLA